MIPALILRSLRYRVVRRLRAPFSRPTQVLRTPTPLWHGTRRQGPGRERGTKDAIGVLSGRGAVRLFSLAWRSGYAPKFARAAAVSPHHVDDTGSA